MEEEGHLNLSLAIASSIDDSRDEYELMKRKRKRLNSSSSTQDCEAKILSLLQMREEMLKLEPKRSKGKDKIEDNRKGLHLIHLLLITATAIDDNNGPCALENLTELYQSVSLLGDSVQRVVAYFADGLAARLLTRKSPFYNMIMKEPTIEGEFLAFTDLYRVSPYYQFAHFTANQTIMEVFEKEVDTNNHALHVIDFDISYGFQWPSLIQSLSEKATNSDRISLRITGFGRSLEELRETETRLMSFGKGFRDVVVEFHGILRGSDFKFLNLTRKRRNETVAVNLVFHLNTLNDSSRTLSQTLKSIHSLKPSIVTLVEQEGSRSRRSFLSRFMESLHYFAAMFDSLDDCLPLESRERLGIEKNHLGKEIRSMLNYDYRDIVKDCPMKYEKMETWKAKMESHGFEGIKLSSKSLMQAKLLLKIRSSHYFPVQFDGGNGGFRVFERDDSKAISLAWQDRCLLTASSWQCL